MLFEAEKAREGRRPAIFLGFPQQSGEAGPVLKLRARALAGKQAKHPRGRLKRQGCLFGCGWKRTTKKVASGQAGFFAARAL